MVAAASRGVRTASPLPHHLILKAPACLGVRDALLPQAAHPARPSTPLPPTLGVLLAGGLVCSWLSRYLLLHPSRPSTDDPHAAQAAAPPDHAIHPQPYQGKQWCGWQASSRAWGPGATASAAATAGRQQRPAGAADSGPHWFALHSLPGLFSHRRHLVAPLRCSPADARLTPTLPPAPPPFPLPPCRTGCPSRRR